MSLNDRILMADSARWDEYEEVLKRLGLRKPKKTESPKISKNATPKNL